MWFCKDYEVCLDIPNKEKNSVFSAVFLFNWYISQFALGVLYCFFSLDFFIHQNAFTQFIIQNPNILKHLQTGSYPCLRTNLLVRF